MQVSSLQKVNHRDYASENLSVVVVGGFTGAIIGGGGGIVASAVGGVIGAGLGGAIGLGWAFKWSIEKMEMNQKPNDEIKQNNDPISKALDGVSTFFKVCVVSGAMGLGGLAGGTIGALGGISLIGGGSIVGAVAGGAVGTLAAIGATTVVNSK